MNEDQGKCHVTLTVKSPVFKAQTNDNSRLFIR